MTLPGGSQLAGARAAASDAAVWRTVWIDGIAVWSPAWPDWDSARAAFLAPDANAAAGVSAEPPVAPPVRVLVTSPLEPPHASTVAPPVARTRPAPTLLAANERRRAPDAVLLALQVAEAAMAASGHDAKVTASVFTSAHGDLPTTDALCRTLATDPLLLSPTRFHHSVHNAASGYWAIASGSRAPSTALSAHEYSFGAGLLEALTTCATDGGPVLLVGHDTEACGALASVNPSRGLLAVALVLSPRPTAASRHTLVWSLSAGDDDGSNEGSDDDDSGNASGGSGGNGESSDSDSHSGKHDTGRHTGAGAPALRSAAARALAANAMADALPLFERLACGGAAELAIAPGPGSPLRVRIAAAMLPAVDTGVP